MPARCPITLITHEKRIRWILFSYTWQEKYVAFPAAYFSLASCLPLRGIWFFFLFLCPVYPFSLLFSSVCGAPHSKISSHAPLFGIFLSFSILSHNFPVFPGHLTLFSLPVPHLSFFTAFFFGSRGTTPKNFFSCPAARETTT